MKIIFSRKGFDSSFGGAPSPIINGCPTSVPIPTEARSETTYRDLDLGDIVEKITRGRLTAESHCHYDPMFEAGRCAFGQTRAAQSHLANNGVGVGDVFLFFGLFSQADGSDRHHRIFGYLKVEEVTHPGAKPSPASNPSGFSRRHPHMIGTWNANNTIYLGSGNTAVSDTQELRLSLPNGPVSHWRIPSWLRHTGLTFHGDPARWGPNCILRTTSPGQEFVTNIAGSSEAEKWLCQIVDSINGTTAGRTPQD